MGPQGRDQLNILTIGPTKIILVGKDIPKILLNVLCCCWPNWLLRQSSQDLFACQQKQHLKNDKRNLPISLFFSPLSNQLRRTLTNSRHQGELQH